jgi:hypothetical protein
MDPQPDLSDEELLAKYRHRARLARCRAINSKIPELQNSFNALARLWETMADDLQPSPRSSPKDWLATTQKLDVRSSSHR